MIKNPTYTINGRNLVSGETELSVRGITGRVRFHAHVTTDKGEQWLDCWKLPRGQRPGHWVSVTEDRVTTVHNQKKARPV